MAKSDSSSPGGGGAQSIAQLTTRHDKLHTRKIQADTQLEAARKSLEALQAESRASYGTDDVAQLHAQLAELTAANETKRAGYQASLDAIEKALAEVEARFTDPGPPSSGASEVSF